MDSLDKRKVASLIHKIGLDNNLSDKEVRDIVESQFLFTYLKLRELDLDTVDTVEKLQELKTSFIYRSFGKLILSEPLFKRRIKQKETGINLNLKKWKKEL